MTHAAHHVHHNRAAERRAHRRHRAGHRTGHARQHDRHGAGHVRHGHSPAHPSAPATPVSPTPSLAAPIESASALAPALEAPATAVEQPAVAEEPPVVEEPVPAPANTEPPSIGGPVVEGATLNATAGAWSPEPTSLEFQWQECNAAGEECVNVSEATSSTYELAESDVGATVRVAVTAYDRGGTGHAWSPPTRTVLPPAPTNATSPTISGKAMEGETLKASSGTWWHDPTTYAYQWELCGGKGETCATIGGATGSTYKVGASAVKHRLRVSVTASNAGGSTPATSADTSMVEAVEPPPQRPVNTALPTVTGKTMEGETLKGSAGTWTGNPTSFAYQWQACNALGEGCLAIAGAASSSYPLVSNNVGGTLRVLVTATNSGGPTQASSAATAVIEAVPPPPPPPAPVNTVLPSAAGSPVEGETLIVNSGAWSNSPTSFAYQWQDCNSSGESCSSIGGATATTYKLAAGDVGSTLRAVVTATNSGGSTQASSPATAVVEAVPPPPPPAPVNTALPAVTGTSVEGETLKASAGSWSNSPTSFSYQWKDCNSSGTSCAAIGGATSSTRVLASSDVGHTLRVVVKATNSGGSGEATSAASATVVAAPPPAPVNTVLPSISGTTEEGKTLSAGNGTWSNSPTSFSYQWEDCNTSGASCSAISGATASTRVLTSGDVGHTIKVVVKATNAGGFGEATSAATSVVAAVSGGGGELHPNTEARNCFENPEYEGTARITACGYPTPENVGAEAPVADGGTGKKCSELPASGSISSSKAGEKIENKNINGTITINKENVTVKDVCANATGSSSVLTMECGQAKGSKVEDSNIYGSTILKNSKGEKGPVNFSINNDCEWAGSEGQLGVAKKDVFYYCSSCIHGNWEVDETYAIANAGELAQSGNTPEPPGEGWHNEAIYFNSQEIGGGKHPGKIVGSKDTFFTPGASVAIAFGNTNGADGGAPCEDKFQLNDSFVAGSGQMFEICGSANTGKATGEINIKETRFARCTGTNGTYDGGERCNRVSGWEQAGISLAATLGVTVKGEYIEAWGEGHGYFPKGQANVGNFLGCPPTDSVCPGGSGGTHAWEGNFWDNDGEVVAENGG